MLKIGRYWNKDKYQNKNKRLSWIKGIHCLKRKNEMQKMQSEDVNILKIDMDLDYISQEYSFD